MHSTTCNHLDASRNYDGHTLLEPSPKTFWMVVRLGSLGYSKHDAHPTKEHSTFTEAYEEAKRLAEKHPAHARGFAVLQAQRIVKAEVTLTVRNLA